MQKRIAGRMTGGMGRRRLAGRVLVLGAIAALLCAALPAMATALPARFATEGPGAGQIEGEPQGVAIEQESGDVYVSDQGNNRVDVFGPEGEFLRAWGWGVADGESEELQVCTIQCFAGLVGSGAGEFDSPEGIAVNNDPLSPSHGDVYVLDTRNFRVQRFSATGELLGAFGEEGAGPGQFQGLNGRSIAIDATGTVYVADKERVQRFSEAGAQEGEVAFPGIGQISNLALDSSKDIYLNAAEPLGVHKYDPSGTELGSARDEAGFGEGLAIAIGPGDELFVNDFRPPVHHILTFNAEGEQTASFDRGGQDVNAGHGIAYSEHTKALYLLNTGAVRIVTPPPPGPFVLLESEQAGEVQPTSATLSATVNPEGPEASNCHFEYGTSTAYGQSTPEAELTGAPFEDQPISAPLTGLTPSSTYHFRAACENAAKEATTGPDETFTTLPPVSIEASFASQVNATSARLGAQLNPHGVKSEYRFEYGLTTAYGQSAPIPDGSTGAGSTPITVESLIQELTPSTTYHYRVLAHNELGSVIGPDQTFKTQGPSSILPDGRTWEMVSPPNKHGSPLEPITEEGGMLQAAAGGGGMAYVALGPINGEPKGVRSPHNTQLLATRSPSGWATQDITTPHEEISIIHAGFPSEYRFFSEDLGSSLVEPEGVTRLEPENPANTERTPYRREADGSFVALVTTDNVPAGTHFGGEEKPGSGLWGNGVEFRTATPDLAHVVLASPQILAPGFETGFEANGEPNFYELTAGELTLVSVLSDGRASSEANLAAAVGQGGLSMRGAVSSDGNRVAFETNGAGVHLYLRDLARAQTLQLDEPQLGAAGGAGAPVFQAASEDGSRVLFTDPSRLTADATAKAGAPDLYMCEVEVKGGQLACALSDLSVDPNPGEAASVQGEVSAIDVSGAHVYFAANGVLTSTPNARGETAVPGVCNSEGEADCNLYEYDTSAREISLVAVLSSHDDPDWAGRSIGLGNLTARSSPNGRYYTFMSQRSLTGYDNRDAQSGQRDAEVFQLDTQSDELRCISCDPTGARPDGFFDPSRAVFPGPLVDHAHSWLERWVAASIPGWTRRSLLIATYQSRYLDDSGREFFNSSDTLVPQDTNNVNDVYEFEPPGTGDCTSASETYSASSGGCVSLISSGSSRDESAFLDASQSGDEVFMLTSSRLVKTDTDAALDVYDAHVCSSSSPCPPPAPSVPAACEGDSCQNPSSPPGETTPASLSYKGPQNPPPPAPAPKAKAKAPTRAQLLAKALASCKKKKPKKQRVSCERQARKRYGVKASKKAKGKRARHAQRGRGR